jgi:hypothetical protein
MKRLADISRYLWKVHMSLGAWTSVNFLKKAAVVSIQV